MERDTANFQGSKHSTPPGINNSFVVASNTNSTNDSHSTGSENNANENHDQLEHKIRTMASTYIQKRDEACRAYQLSLERYKLVQEERNALSATVHDLKQKLHTLEQQKQGRNGEGDGKDSLHVLKLEVEHLAKEFSFQHQELVQKRYKIEEMILNAATIMKKNNSTRTNLEKFVCNRRIKLKQEQDLIDDSHIDFDRDLLYDDSTAQAKEDADVRKVAASGSYNDVQDNCNHQMTENDIREIEDDDTTSNKSRSIPFCEQLLRDELNWCDGDGSRFLSKLPSMVQDIVHSINNRKEKLDSANEVLYERIITRYNQMHSSTNGHNDSDLSDTVSIENPMDCV